jgi:PPOX class probable F420-dependent enzyme
VTVLVDHYFEDWLECWWVRIDGQARILHEGEEFERARKLLTGRYEQYRDISGIGPVIAVRIERWSGWAARQP